MAPPAKNDQFAMAHGFESYPALREASAPLPSSTSSNWFVTEAGWAVAVDDKGGWFAWREAQSDGEGPEACPDADFEGTPLATPARRREIRKPEDLAPELGARSNTHCAG